MRSTRLVTGPEFSAFLAAYAGPLEAQRVGQIVAYVDTQNGADFPDNMVASFLPAGSGRRRDSGWRVVMDEQETENA